MNGSVCVVAETTEQVVAVLRGPFWFRCWKSDSTRFTLSAPTDDSTESTAVVVVVLQLHFSLSCPVSYYCKEKNLHAAQSTGICWAGLYRISPSQKGQETRRRQQKKKEDGREKAKKEGSNKPRGSLISFFFSYILRIPLCIRFCSPRFEDWKQDINHSNEERVRKGTIDRTMGVSQRREWKRIWKIRVALMSGAEIPEHVATDGIE